MTQSTKLEVLKHFISGGKIHQHTDDSLRLLILEISEYEIIDNDGDRRRIKSTLHSILKGEWQIYEEKPKLEWYNESYLGCESYIDDAPNCYDITLCGKLYLTMLQTYNYKTDFFIGTFDTIEQAKQAAQKHYEENN